MTTELHVGDIGTIITVTVTDAESGDAVDISGATVKALFLRKPGGTVLQKDPTYTTDGSDGKLSYTTVAGDLNTAGNWRAQVYVKLPAGEWYSSTEIFNVLANTATYTAP